MPSLSKRINIVAFDVPYPADYGGVIDIYCKIKALHEAGVEVLLHCYKYGRKKSKRELLKYCKEVHYYKRQSLKNPFIGTKPYIVNSRNGEVLLNNLCKNDYPILFEGLHCTYYLDHPDLANRYKIVRTHNVEHHYYKQLEKSELSYFKKYFFRIESDKLRKYEQVLKHANLIAAISPADRKYFDKKYENVSFLPAFQINLEHEYPGKKGKYLLYHGNLGVAENYMAAMELTKHVFSKVDYPCYIMGNNPPKELEKLITFYPNVHLKVGVSNEEIHSHIRDAHINVLYTKQNTGIKLKLLNALYLGKFAVVNPLMVEGSGLEDVCVIGKNFDDMVSKIKEYLLLDYSPAYAQRRNEFLEENYNSQTAINTLLSQIDFSHVELPSRKSEKSLVSGLSQFSSFISYFSL